jgi:hypothetical protein
MLKRLIRLWPFHNLRLGHLTFHWIVQKGSLDAVYEMHMDYWRKYIEPLGSVDHILAGYSKPTKIDLIMSLAHMQSTWITRQRAFPIETYRRLKSAMEKIA